MSPSDTYFLRRREDLALLAVTKGEVGGDEVDSDENQEEEPIARYLKIACKDPKEEMYSANQSI